ncbi:hypothetical protein TNCV_2656971 [Trichonephila clavipes]|nr:hypothetical protein TNCV_2656971 [Trichonephila clavipes]
MNTMTVYEKHMNDGKITIDRANCKGQFALTVLGEIRLRNIVRSQRCKALAKIITQLNDGTIRTVNKRTVQRSLTQIGFRRRLLTREPMLNARHWTDRLAYQ